MIRPFTQDDTDTVVDIWRAASALAHPFLSRTFIESEARNLRNIYLAFAETWVLEKDGNVVGFVALVENAVAGLFLDPAYHGTGLGHAMIKHAQSARGALTVEVFEKNTIGRKFYASCGFIPERNSVHEPTSERVLHLALEV